MFEGAGVCRKAKKKFKVVHPMLSCIVGAEHDCHNMYKVWEYIEETTKLCKEDNIF